MRHWIFAVALFSGCSSETVTPPPAPPVNWSSLAPRRVVDASADILSAKERALPEAYAGALSSDGFAQLGALLNDDPHFASPGFEDVHGRPSVVHAHEVLFGAFDQRKCTVNRVWRTPNEQTVEWTMSGLQARDWMGVPAKHLPVAFSGVSLLWTTDDGTIVDVHLYTDVAVVKARLGVGPKELLGLPPPTPGATPQVIEQTGAPDENAPAALLRSALDALEGNSEAAYVGSMADDLEIHTLQHAQPARGKDAAKAYFKAMRKAIGQLDTTVNNSWGVVQYAVVEYSIAGEQLAPIGWIPTQRDKVIRLELLDIAEVRDGKVARIWRYDNPSQIVGGVL
jgi:hypothetical protein